MASSLLSMPRPRPRPRFAGAHRRRAVMAVPASPWPRPPPPPPEGDGDEQEVERAMGMDGGIPGTSGEILRHVSSRAYSMRRHLMESLDSLAYDVQHECIPQAILGMDVICQAKSGMGKTAVSHLYCATLGNWLTRYAMNLRGSTSTSLNLKLMSSMEVSSASIWLMNPKWKNIAV